MGFSAENVIMIEMNSGERFPAENVMYHWFSKNPKVDDLANILFDLNLERSISRLQAYRKFLHYNLYLTIIIKY